MDAVDGNGARFSVTALRAAEPTLYFLERDLRIGLTCCGMPTIDIDAQMQAARNSPGPSTAEPEEPSLLLITTTTVPLAIAFVPPVAALLTILPAPPVSTAPTHVIVAAAIAVDVARDIAIAGVISVVLPALAESPQPSREAPPIR